MNERQYLRTQSIEETYRTKRSLNGAWEFALDPDDNGLDDDWFVSDADWPERTTVEVPHAWQEREAYLDYTGVAWYRRRIEIPETDADERTALSFAAVDYEATVWVNGEEIGSHRDGYLPFEFDITDESHAGENWVVVRVFDPDDIEEIPHGKQGKPWYTRVSGMWGDVEIRTRPKTRTTSARVTPHLDTDTAEVELTVETADESRDLSAAVAATSDGETVAETATELGDSDPTVELDIENPRYWTPESPHCYDLTIYLCADGEIVDRYEDYFGMRSFEVTDDRFLLNGEPLRLRGALDQGYYPETLYRPFEEGLFEREIRIAKDLGFNMLRKHIKPAHPDFVEAADRLGILVWEEPANPSVYTERSKREVRDQIRALIERDYNSPSVVAWSLYNEEWGIGGHYEEGEESLWTDEEKQQYLAELYETVREWDSTRPICDNSGWAHVATDINDYHRYFVSPDRTDAWGDDLDHIIAHPADNYGATETDPDESPIVISEFGTWGLFDVDAFRDRYGSEPSWFDHDFFDDPIKRPAGIDSRFENSFLSSVFDGYEDLAAVWQEREFVSIADVIGQMRTREDIGGYVITEFSDIEWEFNGLLDYYREEKAFCDEFASVNGPIMLRLEPHSRTAWSGDEIPIDVVVVNDTADPIEADISWEAFNAAGTMTASVDSASIERITDAFTVSTFGMSDFTDEVTATLKTSIETVTTTERLWVLDRTSAANDGVTALVRGAISPNVAAADNGIATQHELNEDIDVAIVTEVNDSVRAFAEDGGNVLLVPGSDGTMADESPFEFRELPVTESWNLVSSLFYSDSELVGDIVTDRRLGWAFDDLYPYAVVTGIEESDDVHVGYIEGWLVNEGSPLLTRQFGAGTITACTFRVTETYGNHPTATILMSNVIEKVTNE
ncbi:glycoside hydrolase family 2 protein [Haladaptatus caseinilyticus]|uniref:glycoside hydrolase family 2 protein n=1 Tax=Haladaptatus caseinilyticus TaxID=2993314 RepID=UPI00224AB09A|nr:sugar-binding domain-containing protein [Haladaptatus caseinilyticus]